MNPQGITNLNISQPQALCDGEMPFRATHLTQEETAALFERLARYGRRRRAAERGEDWQKVT